MSRRRSTVERFGRMAVGQRVRFDRLVMPPTTLEAWWNNKDEPVCIEQFGEIVEIRLGEVDAFVTLRLDEGGGYTKTFNRWGQVPGGFSSLTVLREAPAQCSLIREAS